MDIPNPVPRSHNIALWDTNPGNRVGLEPEFCCGEQSQF